MKQPTPSDSGQESGNEAPPAHKAGADQTQITSTLNSLSDERLNVKLAKLIGWKLVDGKWWHDDVGDGPPSDYCGMFGRKFAQRLVTEFLKARSVGRAPAANSAPGIPKSDSSTVAGAGEWTVTRADNGTYILVDDAGEQVVQLEFCEDDACAIRDAHNSTLRAHTEPKK